VEPHTTRCDIVICVHDAEDEVRRCLNAVEAHTAAPFRLILVDDGSGPATAGFLQRWTASRGATLLRSETATGYTRAANRGLRASDAPFVVLLNSDTQVTPGWLDRLVAGAESDDRIGAIGPLSNAATWQSVPEVAAGEEWSTNPLPEGFTPDDMAAEIAVHAARSLPRVPIVHGFCLLVRREVLDTVGLFDEETFATGYGEENDFGFRATDAGWLLAVADDAYVHHEMGRSYTEGRRRDLSERANEALIAKHGRARVDAAVQALAESRELASIRGHARVAAAQRDFVTRAAAEFAGKRILFLLPVAGAGGGAVHVMLVSRVLARMGVAATVFNLPENRAAFEDGFPGITLAADDSPGEGAARDGRVAVTYGRPEDLVNLARDYDAVVATAHHSVSWLLSIYTEVPAIVRGYLIQDFEAYFYAPGSMGEIAARNSYGLVPELVRIATTDWVRAEVGRQTGLDCFRCGATVDVDLFRARPRATPSWPDRPLRIAAMIRPESPYRSPLLTMRVLRLIAREFGDEVELVLYGTTAGNPGFAELPQDFPFQLVGRLPQREMAFLWNEVDIFADFSTYQAYGMAAVEAMNCGVATIVPHAGGTETYARHAQNALVVDTSSEAACHAALRQLVVDEALRRAIQRQALRDGPTQFPESSAYHMLAALFRS
jgi:GT2 family glycosyltransferase